MKLNDTIEKILEQIQQPLWEHWYIKEKIGSGAYSCVFKVEAQRSSRRINTAALKIQPITAGGREFINENDKRAYIERQKARADSEAEIMLDLRRFPNIVFYEDEDIREFIVDGKFEGYYSLLRMELLTSVVDLIHKRQFDFSQNNVIKLATDIGKGINGAHTVGIIHRDIKPDNFFVDAYGTYKIGDFNVAKMSDSARTMAGTPGYIAPEVYSAKSDIDAVYTYQADIYSFGICLYRLMNDMLYPFENTDDTETAHSRRYKGEKLPPPRNADSRFAEIILKACEFSTEKRYKDMVELLLDLSKLSTSPNASMRKTEYAARSIDPDMTILAEEPHEYNEADMVRSRRAKVDINSSSIEFGRYPEAPGMAAVPIRWRVLNVENDTALLITEKLIDAMKYSDAPGCISWESSFVRRFLNGQFFSQAFSDDEKNVVLDTDVVNFKNVTFRTPNGGKTTDKVFLLSIEQAQRLFRDDRERSAAPTALARSRGIYTSADGMAWWWLRSSGCSENYAADVDYGGDVDSYGSDRINSIECIRPVIRVSLSFLENEEKSALIRSVSTASVSEGSNAVIETGDTVKFGEYFTESKYNKDPILWQVLAVDDVYAMVISKYCIDAAPFDSRSMAVTWRQSELRKWLNTDFSQSAFGGRLSFIRETSCHTEPNEIYKTGGGIDAKDKVFLLSLEEAKKYFPDNAARAAQAAPASREKGLFVFDNGCAWWWLRSSGNNKNYAANVDYGGDVDFYGSDATSVNGIRPVIWVNVSALEKLN